MQYAGYDIQDMLVFWRGRIPSYQKGAVFVICGFDVFDSRKNLEWFHDGRIIGLVEYEIKVRSQSICNNDKVVLGDFSDKFQLYPTVCE